MGEFRKEFKQKNPKNKSVTAVGKAAGGRWKNLSESIMVYQLCKGVAFCHGRGVRHHDLKPHNLQIGGWVNEVFKY
ncbi:cyclin-dependent kinase 5 homolog isoform X3 [Triticum aestivum]|uniref:cyclin-dependent kinase 5 homolog isoform X3 n=1 Tax=Triticum aestivum TaxID=4565 RepID=UPI00098B6B27|nr:cyclin-dependent kinase 5 homolog isoform X3 [Aegilops tauschii subsp. strangulata]XP_044357951.1 cyclin-dependent kinase 5 homolog isoform X3 [Triticum aestivum]